MSEKSPGKYTTTSHRHLSFPVPLTHLTDFQSPEPICWERNPTLARNETTSTPRHTPTPQHCPSPPLHPLLYSPLSSLPAHQRPGRETWRLAWSPLCLPTLHFKPRSHSSLPSFLGFCANLWDRERKREGECKREDESLLQCWHKKQRNASSSSFTVNPMLVVSIFIFMFCFAFFSLSLALPWLLCPCWLVLHYLSLWLTIKPTLSCRYMILGENYSRTDIGIWCTAPFKKVNFVIILT